MRAEGGSPNLINGVSLQPSEVRLTSQLEESVNQFPTITRGLVPRNPALLKGIIGSTNPENSTTHLIDRDGTERYIVTINRNGVEVKDLAGNTKKVNAPGGFGYLSGALSGDLEAMTVADHTFILNKRKTVAASSAKTPAWPCAGLVHIVQGDYHTDYSIVVAGSTKARYVTEGGPYTAEADARKAEVGVRPAVIAAQLASGAAPSGLPTAPLPVKAISSLSATLGVDYKVSRYDNVIYIVNTKDVNFSLEVRAGSETKARAHKDMTQHFSELPRKGPNGFSVKIAGSQDTRYDDYYVRFDKPSNSAQGRWKETVAPNVRFRIDPSTMPHILVRESNGTFTFKPAVWAERKVGDLDTNPWPSFVGRKMDGMIFFKNRVGFFSGESVSLSRHDSFFDFFRESILTPLDTDPIDVAISYPQVSDIKHAIPFAGEMMLFTTSIPFRLSSSGDLFTPTSVSIEPVLSNQTSNRARPVVAGERLYFVNDVPSGCFVHEFIYEKDGGVREAPTITDHVNGYISTGAYLIDADEDMKVLALVSAKEPNAIYTYKWLWIGNEKAQAAWQKWTIADPIIGMKFFGEELIVVTNRATTREILGINCHEAWNDGALTAHSPVYLDRRTNVTGVYDAVTNKTTFTLPYPALGASLVFYQSARYGLQPPAPVYSGNKMIVDGSWAFPARAGFEFPSYGVLSKFHQRSQNNQGAWGNALPGVDLNIAHVVFQTGPTVQMNVEVTRSYRKPYLYKLSSALMGTKMGKLGPIVAGAINKALSVLCKAEDLKVKFGNRGPYLYSVLSYRWTGEATSKTI